jgi:hypothetical protein
MESSCWTGTVMGLGPTQGDEKTPSLQQPLSTEPLTSPLSSRAKPRDLQFRGPFVEMFFDIAERSGEICGPFVEMFFDRTQRSEESAGLLPFPPGTLFGVLNQDAQSRQLIPNGVTAGKIAAPASLLALCQ